MKMLALPFVDSILSITDSEKSTPNADRSAFLPSRDITAKYLQGKANLTEQEELQQWRKSDVEHEAQFKAQEKLWKLTEYTPDYEVDTEHAWNQTIKIRAKFKDQHPIRKCSIPALR